MFYVTTGLGRFGFGRRDQAVRFAERLCREQPIGTAVVTTVVFGELQLVHMASGPLSR